MSTRVALRHRIVRQFSRPVRLSTHWLRLRPAPGVDRRITAYALRIDAEPHFVNWVRDPFENHLARLDLPEPISRLGLDLELIAELNPVNPFDFLVERYAVDYPFEYDPQLHKELAPYLALPSPGPRLDDWLRTLDATPANIVELLTRVNQEVHASLACVTPVQPGAVDVEMTLAKGADSPWALAWLATLALRALGLAARFVSGYRVLLTAEPTASFHAWTEAYLPGAAWIGLDPAGGLYADEGYLPLAAAPDPLRALPVVGYLEACEEEVSEQVEVRRLIEEPPVGPLTPAQRRDMQAVAQRIDTDLSAAGMALTMHTGLTFVSAVEPDRPEWNTEVLGLNKRRAAEHFLVRLRDRLAPGGVLQAGQGERFAGEPRPRWRLSCLARADGKPVCRNSARISWVQVSGELTLDDARRFGQRLAHALGLAPRWLAPAYEDGLHALWHNENRVSCMPDTPELCDPVRRQALAERLSQESAVLRGYVLPLRWDSGAGHWVSGVWRFRRGNIYLLPGDAPLGYRLPLEGLPLATHRQVDPERCQFDDRPVLSEVHGEISARLSQLAPSAGEGVKSEADAEGFVQTPRTAICMEIREGRLVCFLPPLTHLEHYLELVAAVEAAADCLPLPVVLEGYEPPEDHRLRRIVLEPDTGVLRLRLPEALDTVGLETMIRTAYEEASHCGLRSERIMHDGSRFPPGVRAPLVLGGREPAQSPFLQRPELLRSLIAYWHRHPALSYLFADRIGPAGFSARVDEGRDTALYELSLALERLPAVATSTPWVADRVLRHQLADPAGDMRQAEIRIDELYDPVQVNHRLGRVTLGAFGMAPTYELAIAQTLLVRGLVARFLRFPESPTLAAWGPQLHDRFLLPRKLWEDFCSVLTDLGEAGYPFQPGWFEPLMECRFPLLGRVRFNDIALELRQAHEPWSLLAEEVTAGGLARFLDSANDRVQVLGTGLTSGRYALEVNGERVPLQPTGVTGEYVAGVRFKVWEPPATLHPTAPPVEALVFDLIDAWTSRVLGGFTYVPERPRDWGPVAAPLSVEAGLPPDQESRRALPPAGQPAWPGRGQFLHQGSGRVSAIPLPETTDPAHPFLLDLSFPR